MEFTSEEHTIAFFAALYGDGPVAVECDRCDGEGTVACSTCDGTGEHTCDCGDEHDCDDCDGDGEEPCDCGGGEIVLEMHPADAWTLPVIASMGAR